MEELQKRKRKLPKRYQESDQEEGIPKVTNSKPRQRRSIKELDPDPTEEADNGRLDIEEPEEERMATSSKSQPKVPKIRLKPKGDGPPSRKKARKLVISEEDEDDYLEAEAVPEGDEFEEDDHLSGEEEKSRGAKGKAKASAGRGKKRKAKVDPVSSPLPALERTMSSDLPSNKKAKPNLNESLLEGDVASTPEFSATTSPAALKPDSPVPQLKKLKLPAIKKNKTQGTVTGTSTPTSATPATKPRIPLDIMSASGTKQSEIRKAQLGASDLDLSNKSIYQELFKTGSEGGAPRTGLNRRAKEEERRKELNKMKEEYLAKRAREEAHCFDLQARHEKITRFEDKLRCIRSTALFPNHMAAKWKEMYEREKRRQKEQHEWNEDGANGREEGEVK